MADPLTYDQGPLVWVDCEMTGLDALNDKLLEIAVIITNGRLEPVDEGIEFIIRTDKEVLDNMNEWCIDQHGRSGLTASCLSAADSHEEVETKVLAYIQKWIPEAGAGLLAGSTVHADMRFLLVHMPSIMKHLSYRILGRSIAAPFSVAGLVQIAMLTIDVSTIKEVCKRWYPSIAKKQQSTRRGESAHRALDDIQASIRELEFYRDNIFLPLEPPKVVPASETDMQRKTAL